MAVFTVDDARYYARIVRELAGYRGELERLRREMCSEYHAPRRECHNGMLGWSKELGIVYDKLREADAELRELIERYKKLLLAAALRELAVERAKEILKEVEA